MKKTKLLFTAIVLCALFAISAFALGEEIIIDLGPIFGGTELTQGTGDANLDGKVDRADISLLAECLATNARGFTSEQLLNANLYTGDDEVSNIYINIKDLVALAQYVNVLENGSAQTERIVSYSDVNIDQDNSCRNYYTVFNPYTGMKSTNIAGSRYSEQAKDVPEALTAGTVATFTDGKLDESSASKFINTETDFVWLIDYDTENNTITVLPEGSTDESDAVTYVYTENTAFSKLEDTKKTYLFKWGAMSKLDANTLFNNISRNYYKCYNDKILVGDSYNTKYAKNIKMYISPIENTNVLDYAIVIVHGDEALENLNM